METKKWLNKAIRAGLFTSLVNLVVMGLRVVASGLSALSEPFFAAQPEFFVTPMLTEIGAALVAGFFTSLVTIGPALHAWNANIIKKNDADMAIQFQCLNRFWLHTGLWSAGFAVVWYVIVFPFFAVGV